MSTPQPHHDHESGSHGWSRTNQWLLWIGLAAAVAWLFFRHSAHLFEIAPFLIILACPLMHLFGHGHGGHGHGSQHEKTESRRSDERSGDAP